MIQIENKGTIQKFKRDIGLRKKFKEDYVLNNTNAMIQNETETPYQRGLTLKYKDGKA